MGCWSKAGSPRSLHLICFIKFVQTSTAAGRDGDEGDSSVGSQPEGPSNDADEPFDSSASGSRMLDEDLSLGEFDAETEAFAQQVQHYSPLATASGYRDLSWKISGSCQEKNLQAPCPHMEPPWYMSTQDMQRSDDVMCDIFLMAAVCGWCRRQAMPTLSRCRAC